MPKQKAKNKLTDKEQFERFKKTAQELDVDESGKPLEDAFKKVAPSNTPSRQQGKGSDR